jgi:hypothetical protein
MIEELGGCGCVNRCSRSLCNTRDVSVNRQPYGSELVSAVLTPTAAADAAMELEEDNVEEEGGGAGVSLADCDGKFMPPLDSGADGDCGDAAAPAATCCRCP